MAMSGARWVESPIWEPWRRTISLCRYLNRSVRVLIISIRCVSVVHLNTFAFAGGGENRKAVKRMSVRITVGCSGGWVSWYLIPAENSCCVWGFFVFVKLVLCIMAVISNRNIVELCIFCHVLVAQVGRGLGLFNYLAKQRLSYRFILKHVNEYF